MILSSLQQFVRVALSPLTTLFTFSAAALLPIAATLNAQQPSFQPSFGVAGMGHAQQASPETLVLDASPSSRGCPVSMQAKQAGLGDMIKVRNFSSSSQQAMQQIRLTLERSEDSLRIVSARVTVRGTSAKGRAVQTLATDAENADKITTLNVHFSASGDLDSARLVLEGFTSVTSITLKSLTYSDGSSWTSSEDRFCRTSPDPLVLVGIQ